MKFTAGEEAEIALRLSMGDEALVEAFFWLGAAVASQRGLPTEKGEVKTSGEDATAPDNAAELLKSAFEYMTAEGYDADRIAYEIRITTEHLRRGGWPVSSGSVH